MKLLRKLGHTWDKFQALYCRYLGRNYKCGCGHTTKWKTIVTIHGYEGIIKAPSNNPDYCPQGWAKAAIRCAWCGETIVPGDGITLYSPGKSAGLIISTREPSEAQKKRNQADFVVPEQAVVYQREPRLVLVGCLGWDCADTGADHAGFWVMPGKVQRVPSLQEMLIGQGKDDPMIVDDQSDPGQAVSNLNDNADN